MEELAQYINNQDTSGAQEKASDDIMIIEEPEEAGPSQSTADVPAQPLKKQKRGRKAKGPRQLTVEDHWSWEPEVEEDDYEPMAVSRRVKSLPST